MSSETHSHELDRAQFRGQEIGKGVVLMMYWGELSQDEAIKAAMVYHLDNSDHELTRLVDNPNFSEGLYEGIEIGTEALAQRMKRQRGYFWQRGYFL